jgi:hypothetical protein
MTGDDAPWSRNGDRGMVVGRGGDGDARLKMSINARH